MCSKKQDSNMNVTNVCNEIKQLSSMPKEDYFDLQFEQHCIEFLNEFTQADDFSVSNSVMESFVFNCNFTHEEIDYAIRCLKGNKSCGIDLIPANCIKAGRDQLVHHLKLLFDYILAKESFPPKWAEGLRIAIPKGADDIRPITIEPIFGKIFEIMVDKRISFINEAFDREDCFNGGFVKGSMTQDNILILLGCIQKQLLFNKKLFVAFVDFRKAFNFVNKNILFYKLFQQGFTGRMFRLLKDMYCKVKARIKFKHLLYDWVIDNCGTNQGGPLSPNMFRRMLSDLSSYLEQEAGIVFNGSDILLHMLWADDLILVSESKEGLQSQLNGVFNFCKRSQMIVNSLKTKIMLFGKKEECNFIFNGKQLEVVQDYKYLGVIFNSVCRSNGSVFKEMKDYTRDKALKACFSCFKKLSSIGKVTPKIGFKLFDSFVSPVIDYACEIWSDESILQIERVHVKFLKMLLGVKMSTCNQAVYCETGRFPVVLKQKQRLFKYWSRLTRLHPDKIVKQSYEYLKYLTDLGFHTWVSKVKILLEENDMLHLYEQDSISVVEEQKYANVLITRLQSNFKEECLQSLHSFSSLRHYVGFKCTFTLECYLENIVDFKVRKAISRLRLNSHNLAVEKGRHHKPKIPLEERLCRQCNLGVVEDEQHFILICPFLKEEREILFDLIKLYDEVILSEDSSTLFVNLMSSLNVKILFGLGKFIIKGLKKRKV